MERRLGNVERARQLYDQAIQLFTKEQDDLGRANALQSIGDLAREAGKPAEARDIYFQAIGLYQKEQAPTGLAYTTAEILRCLHALGSPADEMEKMAGFAVQMAQATGAPGVLQYVAQVLAEVGLPDPGVLKQRE